MNDDKNENIKPNNTENKNDEQEIDVHNPFNKEADKKITEDDVENEQLFKEAQTERD